MRTRGEIKTKIQPLVYGVGTSTYFTPTRIESAIDDAYLTVASMKPWGEIRKGFVTNTIASQEYYDYPNNCQSESIFKISVDGDSKYEKLNFEDYLRDVENNYIPDRKYWSEFGRQIFIHPIPTTTGSANLIFWGTIQAASLTGDGDVTMFTDWCDPLNEAIMQFALADLLQGLDTITSKNSSTLSQLALAKGEAIVNREYKKIADRLQRKLKDRPQFAVPDFFGSSSDNIGNFSINNIDE